MPLFSRVACINFCSISFSLSKVMREYTHTQINIVTLICKWIGRFTDDGPTAQEDGPTAKDDGPTAQDDGPRPRMMGLRPRMIGLRPSMMGLRPRMMSLSPSMMDLRSRNGLRRKTAGDGEEEWGTILCCLAPQANHLPGPTSHHPAPQAHHPGPKAHHPGL